jgi:hypothetical protein
VSISFYRITIFLITPYTRADPRMIAMREMLSPCFNGRPGRLLVSGEHPSVRAGASFQYEGNLARRAFDSRAVSAWDDGRRLAKSRRIESPRKRAARTRADTPALLKGLLYGPDGAAFAPTHTRKGGRLYRYYVSQTVLKHGAGSCPVGRVRAGEIEAAVIDQLHAVFRQPEIVAGTWKAARAHADDITEAEARAALQQLDPLWDELFPGEQSRILTLLVERVDIGTDGLNVRLRVDGLNG